MKNPQYTAQTPEPPPEQSQNGGYGYDQAPGYPPGGTDAPYGAEQMNGSPYGPYYGPPPWAAHHTAPPPWHYGPAAYPPPQQGWYPPPGMQPPPPQGAAANPYEDMLNDMADQSGLSSMKNLFNWGDGEFWKGALVGAAVVMLLTNEELRSALLGGAAKTADSIKSGLGGSAESDEEDQTQADAGEENEEQTS